ncbi:urea carboxylase-associated family protein [Streptomyces asoensis]|uniref:urea carboxylase-associated family protein n=1 Tax=Streptomyces asoensis TaxID=249586 RepID=UPI0033F50841
MQTIKLSARTSTAVRVARGGALEVINTHGSQVVDTWAVLQSDPEHGLSMEHTRAIHGRVYVRAGDVLFDDRRQPLLAITADTSPGIHDTLIPACSAARYRELGYQGEHDNCSANYCLALTSVGLPVPVRTPGPLNLFMNVPVDVDGSFKFSAPVSRPGDSVLLEALEDVVIILSACPQDMVPVNGESQEPQDAEIRVYEPVERIQTRNS